MDGEVLAADGESKPTDESAKPSLKPAVQSTIAEAGISRPEYAQAEKPALEGKLAKSEKTQKQSNVERLIIIAIDAGHGGEDLGVHGGGGTNEKDVTLAIALRLKEHIEREENMRAVLIRDGDYFIPLQQRMNKAHNLKADLYVSIHTDSFVNPDASGSSVFALSESGATSAAARWLAKKENGADLIGGFNIDVKDAHLKQILLDVSQTATINDSLKLGKAVLHELGGINRLHKGSVEQAGFAELKSPDIPSIRIMTGFISNPNEEKKLKDEAYQSKIANAILTGIKRYFTKNPPLAKSELDISSLKAAAENGDAKSQLEYGKKTREEAAPLGDESKAYEANAKRGAALSDSVRSSLSKAVNDSAAPRLAFASQDGAYSWLADMSTRLEKNIPDKEIRFDFLKTVHFEATRAGLDPQLVLGLIQTVSGFKKYAVSCDGARGFMQVMPFWVNEIGTSGQDLFHLRINLRYGCTILRHYLDIEKGDLFRALGRYNGSLGKSEFPNMVLSAWKYTWSYPQPKQPAEARR